MYVKQHHLLDVSVGHLTQVITPLSNAFIVTHVYVPDICVNVRWKRARDELQSYNADDKTNVDEDKRAGGLSGWNAGESFRIVTCTHTHIVISMQLSCDKTENTWRNT